MYTVEELDHFASLLGQVWNKSLITDNVRDRIRVPDEDNYLAYLTGSGVGYVTAPTMQEAMNKHWEIFVAKRGETDVNSRRT